MQHREKLRDFPEITSSILLAIMYGDPCMSRDKDTSSTVWIGRLLLGTSPILEYGGYMRCYTIEENRRSLSQQQSNANSSSDMDPVSGLSEASQTSVISSLPIESV
ncbi:hypothetical protein STEG23_028542 [Scotinomys teguina]